MALGKLIEKMIEEYLTAREILERVVVPNGTGAHINMPKKYRGKKVKIIIPIEKQNKLTEEDLEEK